MHDDNKLPLGFFSLLHEIEAVCHAIFNGARYGLKIRFPHAFVMTFLFRKDISLRRKVESIIRITFQHMWSLAKFAGIYKTILSLLKYISRRLHDLGYCHHEWDVVGQNRSKRRIEADSAIRYWFLKGLQLFVHGWSSYVANDNAGVTAEPKEALSTPSAGTKVDISTEVLRPKPPGLPELSHHAFLAGAAGGYLVWGRHFTSLHYQIVMYLASRVMVGCAKLWMSSQHANSNSEVRMKHNNKLHSESSNKLSAITLIIKDLLREYGYPMSATVVWGIVMMLFENYPEVLHPSLKRSMDEIYGVPSIIKSGKDGERQTNTPNERNNGGNVYNREASVKLALQDIKLYSCSSCGCEHRVRDLLSDSR